jgi:hypothetical protein
LLEFKSEGLYLEHRKYECKCKGANTWRCKKMDARRVRSVINAFIVSPWGIPNESIYRAVRGRFILSKQPLTIPQIVLSTRSQSHYSHSWFTIISIPSQSRVDTCPSPVMPPISILRRRDIFGAATMRHGLRPFVPAMPPLTTSVDPGLHPRSWLRHPAKRSIRNLGKVIRPFWRSLRRVVKLR